jgi:hypothetical protein
LPAVAELPWKALGTGRPMLEALVGCPEKLPAAMCGQIPILMSTEARGDGFTSAAEFHLSAARVIAAAGWAGPIGPRNSAAEPFFTWRIVMTLRAAAKPPMWWGTVVRTGN